MKSFMQGKKAMMAEQLRPPPQFAAERGQLGLQQFAAASTADSGAHVEIVKEGDKVVRLVVTCACGERVEVECLYSAGR
ncbi:MAG: hypothetical protein JNK23_03125 [Opitutaceae bacterium]|nr:hypothetical protein [Opitutaceae bacterium]